MKTTNRLKRTVLEDRIQKKHKQCNKRTVFVAEEAISVTADPTAAQKATAYGGEKSLHMAVVTFNRSSKSPYRAVRRP